MSEWSPGSPPHTRGIPSRCRIAVPGRRFTPAYAGNTLKHLTGVFSQGVHPRIRGEYFRLCVVIRVDTGSPPHTRGIPWIIFKAPAAVRFTPAYAGNTLGALGEAALVKVHPRIRGEYSKTSLICHVKLGSPPHTRGILIALHACLGFPGFTPAYAGNTN